MCGIVGFIDKTKKDKKEKIINDMMDKIIHRGPNSKGTFINDDVVLGFRRLSIIDLEGGTQPIYNEKEDMVITFNGEIYNFKELRKDLEEKGHIFKTNTDTEVIIHGYEEYGKEIVKKLRGMFAFVIYNKETNELFGARDHFGIKPFYYYKQDNLFIYGSEIKSFLVHPDFKKELNEEALKPYLTFQFSALEETFFKNVFKLKEGHMFTYKDNEMKIEEYYDVKYEISNKSEQEFIEEINDKIEKSVECHKNSDVALGAFLSGGVDSSYIVSTLMPDKTFSVGFERENFNEIDQAKGLSDILNIENVNKVITPDEFFDNLENIMYHSDEPHANMSAVPLYFLSKMTKEHVTVVLSGEGADELFGGYESYAITKRDLKYRKVPKFIRHALGKFAFNKEWFHGRKFLVRNGLDVEEYYTGSSFIFNEFEKKKVLNKKYLKGKDFREITKPIFDNVKGLDEVTKMQYLDMHLWLVEDILLKADKMTMANSIELRVPILDRVVMDTARTIPTNLKITNDTTKYVFRQSAFKKLPEEWAKRPKWGFPVPFHYWIKEEKYYNKVRDMFNEDFTKEFFKQEELLKMLEEHKNGKKPNGRKIYTIFCFLVWYKRYFIEG
ncbi:MAG: asparagine synthase (glutamine-hydrolyzing) [Lactobacillales bacterium]|nr:asparagine synthase (glutamine-hydrolyzing) [Lactobacillales bacterium]